MKLWVVECAVSNRFSDRSSSVVVAAVIDYYYPSPRRYQNRLNRHLKECFLNIDLLKYEISFVVAVLV